MARLRPRREATRRRRQERLEQLNAALEQYTALLGPAAGAGPPPADAAAFIDAHTATSVWAGPHDTVCAICVEDLAPGDEARTLRCGHAYHRQCVDHWLRRSRLCCLCKRPIDGQGT